MWLTYNVRLPSGKNKKWDKYIRISSSLRDGSITVILKLFLFPTSFRNYVKRGKRKENVL